MRENGLSALREMETVETAYTDAWVMHQAGQYEGKWPDAQEIAENYLLEIDGFVRQLEDALAE